MNRPFLTINTRGTLIDFKVPKVMAIINATPDSFFAGSRGFDRGELKKLISNAITRGADIIDIGGCSTRPGADDISLSEELQRVSTAFEILREMNSQIPASIDTWRAEVAYECVKKWNVSIINDISGGRRDPEIQDIAAQEKVAYVLTHSRGDSKRMDNLSNYKDVTAEVISELSKEVDKLRQKKINDIIIDPGFGFAKNRSQDLQLLNELEAFCMMGLPVLAGLSRKRMVWETLGITAADAYEGTIALDAIAIDRGADIIRVHDVKAAKDTVRLLTALNNTEINIIANND